MRTRVWISTTFLVLGALFLTGGPIPILPLSERSENAESPEDLDRASASEASGLASAPATSRPSVPATEADTPERADLASEAADMHFMPEPVTEPDLEPGLDSAPEDVVRDTLLAAIEHEQRSRPLFVSPGLVDQLARSGDVRIVFETGPDLSNEGATDLLAGPARRARVEVVRVFPLLDFAAATVGPQALLNLIRNPATGQIEIDALHRPSLEQTIPIIGADLAHLDGHDGDGYAVAILDTGVDSTHAMYAARLVEEACFSVQGNCPNGMTEMFGPGAAIPCPLPGCGHGTRIAGIALGEEPGGSLVGVAPHADLIAIQIFSDVSGEPAAFSSDILAGLQHVISLSGARSIAAANLSLGGSVYTTEASCDAAVASQKNAVDVLRAANILTTAAAGNEFFTNAMTTPACISSVIGVGSTSDSDVVSTFSNSAPFLRLLAPGEAVESSRLGGGTSVASGTSMASAHVAGAVAAILEAVPTATADEIDNALVLTGTPILDARNGVTTSRIEVEDAISLLEGSGGGGSTPASTGSGGGGGSDCGLVGIELFLALGVTRIARHMRRRARD